MPSVQQIPSNRPDIRVLPARRLNIYKASMFMTTQDLGYSKSSLEPESPCIGYCSTTFGDNTCVGCGRSAQEVIQWITMSDEEKKAIWTRIATEGTAIRFREK